MRTPLGLAWKMRWIMDRAESGQERIQRGVVVGGLAKRLSEGGRREKTIVGDVVDGEQSR